jgi:hypothetical protein
MKENLRDRDHHEHLAEPKARHLSYYDFRLNVHLGSLLDQLETA